jgi:PAS domain S-box-containing protein
MIKISLIPKILFLTLFLVIVNSFIAIKILPTRNIELKVAFLLGGGFLVNFFIITYSSFLAASLATAFYVKKRLDKLLIFTSAIANGNLDEKINIKSSDEIGELAASLDKMREQIKERIEIAEESRNRAEAILFNVGEGVFAVDLKGEIIIFNQIAEKMLGFSRDQVIGLKYTQVLQFYDSKTKSDYGAFIDKVLLEGKAIVLPNTAVLITSGRAEIPVAVNASPIRNQKGIIVGGIVVFRDITKEKEIEEIRTDLISIASHQLRTPLSEIKGLLSLLLSNIAGPLNGKQIEYLKLLEIANERMINLVNDLLNISRIEQGRMQLNFQMVNLGELSKQVFQSLQIKANEKKQSFSLSIDPGIPPVIADPEKTKEIISNLMENALKYTFEGGTIQARVAAKPEGVWVLVADNGVGIPKNRQKDLFQKFSRIENPLSRVTSGTGLGLYAVKQLVEKQGGSVYFDSTEGQGSTFGFVLPLASKVKEKV